MNIRKKINKMMTCSALVSSCLFAASSNATTNCTVDNVELTQLFSATFDGLVFGKSVVNDGSFFGAIPDIGSPTFGVNRAISISKTEGGDEGVGVITFDGTELDNIAITLPDLTLSIIDGPGPSITTVTTSGASLNINEGIHVLDGGLDANFDRGPAYAGATGGTNIFDFSSFNLVGSPGVVDSCGGGGATTCAGLAALNLDAVRWTLQGTPAAAGTCQDSYTLRLQSDNTSYYEITFDTIPAVAGKAVPVPMLFAYLGLAGLMLIGFGVRKK